MSVHAPLVVDFTVDVTGFAVVVVAVVVVVVVVDDDDVSDAPD